MGLSKELSCEAESFSCCRPNSHGRFQSEVCGFISHWSPGLRGLLRSPPFVRFICVRMWGRRVCQWSDCQPRSSHTPPVSVPPWPRESSPPRLPISAPPTSLDECLFFISLVSDFLAIRFSVSSGCARRRSVSTYTAILVLYIIDCVSASCFVLFLEYFPLLPLGHSSLPSHFG